jgi:acetyl esterase
MTNDRAATASGRRRAEHGVMGDARGEPASARGSDLDPDIRRFIRTASAASAAHPGFDEAPYPQQRRWAEEAREPWRQGGPAMHETRELELPTRHGAVRARMHRPAAGALPALVYLHGGGWTLFSIDTHDRVMREYASRAGCCVIGLDYALSPEHKFPVALEQVVDAIAGLVGQGDALGIDAGCLAVGGDSAGANLSVAASLVRRDAGAVPPPCAMLLNYGAFVAGCSEDACRRFGGPDYMLGCEEMDGYWRNYMRDEADARDPLVCPLRAALAGLPPAFLAIAECDVLAEQNREMADRLAGAGVPVESVTYRGASHSFIEAVSIAAVSDRALQDGSEWLRQAFRTAGRGSAPRHGLNATV